MFLKKFRRRLNNHLSRRYKNSINIAKENSESTVYIESNNVYSFSNKNFTFIGNQPYWTDFKNIKLRKLFFQKAHKVEVIGKGIILDRNDCVNLESTIFQEEYLHKLKSNHLVKFRKFFPSKKLDKAIVLTNYLYGNYYHWITESLGRIALLEIQNLSEYQIILDASAPKFTIDSLVELFGIRPSMIYLKKETRLKVAHILIPSFPQTRNSFTKETNIYHAEIIRKVNAISKAKTTSNPTKRNFIISRKKATQRRMINEELFLEKFNYLNLELIALEELTFKEQMNLFRNAGIIIGTHGAGLANLVFSENPLVIELFPSNRYNRDAFYFHQITSALGIQHVILEYNATNYDRQDLIVDEQIISSINNIITEKLKM
ncbi:glycosyltransferase family 61 protein [Bizionia psychrotolerans]|uniref:glycosyltransferase family 61 protein n=1 Tax=Bizionia psychrotolerans TaxID=1492901 RepID=UPI0006501FB6|nr:glycosyltransferase 61 family protein [Bizionia psychrotolerans]